jgi:bifunctional enzyme CysN/CysC
MSKSTDVQRQTLSVTQAQRAASLGQRARCVWFTGLSGSGKSTIANTLEQCLHSQGRHTYLLDGDNVRLGLNRDLGFGDTDRIENIRRVAEVAKLMVDAGLIVLVSFISPFRTERQSARALFGAGEFIEVFVDTPIDECERRDVKGLYHKARSGLLPNFTGIDSTYEPPERPDLRLTTLDTSAQDCAEQLLRLLDSSQSGDQIASPTPTSGN